MSPLVGVLVLVLLGLLGARFSFERLQRPLGSSLIISAGGHFLFLGFLLGSHGFGLLNRGVIDQLYPFLALGLGWIGLLFGLQLDRRQLGRFPTRFFVIAMAQAALALAVFLAIGRFTADGIGRSSAEVDLVLLAWGATACISTPAGVAIIRRAFPVRGEVSELLLFIASVDALVGIIALQLTYAFHHPMQVGALAGPALSPPAWVAVSAGLGLLFGVFFIWVTRPKPSAEELVLFLLGLVVFAAGTALYLGTSPLFVSTIAGIVVANLSPMRRRIFALLHAWEKPIYVILLILAGALLNFPTWWVLPLAAGYLVVRLVAKVTAGFVALRAIGLPFPAPGRLGLGLVPQGGISLAMAISITLTYRQLVVDGLPVVEVLFSTIVLGVLASELIGPVLTRNLLRAVGELRMPAAGTPASLNDD